MTTLQAVMLGMMISWTPSLVIMALLLWRAPVCATAADSKVSTRKETAQTARVT